MLCRRYVALLSQPPAIMTPANALYATPLSKVVKSGDSKTGPRIDLKGTGSEAEQRCMQQAIEAYIKTLPEKEQNNFSAKVQEIRASGKRYVVDRIGSKQCAYLILVNVFAEHTEVRLLLIIGGADRGMKVTPSKVNDKYFVHGALHSFPGQPQAIMSQLTRCMLRHWMKL